MSVIEMPAFFDAHVHFRQGPIIEVSELTAAWADYAVAMPNTKPPITTAKMALDYKQKIEETARYTNPHFTVLPALYLTETTSPDDIREAADAGIRLAKFYPRSVTTNSDDGIGNLFDLYPCLKAMEQHGLILSLHPEIPLPSPEYDDVLDWEADFFRRYGSWLVGKFPDLKIVFEHITTQDAVNFVMMSPENVAATITAHHLYLTHNDILAFGLRPDNYCKPIAKTAIDRAMLRHAATSGTPHFFLGSDSAPHNHENKYCACGAAGCFTAPIVPELLAEIFGPDNWDELQRFAVTNGTEFYGLPQPQRTLRISDVSMKLPRWSGVGGIYVPVFRPFESTTYSVTY